jgi:hypothetical protein
MGYNSGSLLWTLAFEPTPQWRNLHHSTPWRFLQKNFKFKLKKLRKTHAEIFIQEQNRNLGGGGREKFSPHPHLWSHGSSKLLFLNLFFLNFKLWLHFYLFQIIYFKHIYHSNCFYSSSLVFSHIQNLKNHMHKKKKSLFREKYSQIFINEKQVSANIYIKIVTHDER